MTYDDIAAIFLAPLAEPVGEPDVGTTPARRLRDAIEPIATQGWWSRAAGERLAALGVDFFPGYVWGRAAALGTPTSAVVAATFGVFDRDLIASVYEAGSARVDREEILAARADGGAASVASVATDAECAAVADPLLAALGTLDALGRPLFGGLRALPLPTSPAGRLWRAAELVREHRGDGHLAVLASAGLEAGEANVLTELWLGFELGEYSGTRGFGPEAVAGAAARLRARGWMTRSGLTEEGRTARATIEASTDASQGHAARCVWLGTGADHRLRRADLGPVDRGPVGSRRPEEASGGLTRVEVNADLASWVRRQTAGADRYLFGVTGPPGSGKSTFAELLGNDLGAPVVPMDGFHLPNAVLRERGLLAVKGAPETFAAADFVELVRALRIPSRVVGCPAFDRSIDEPVADRIRVTPDDVVVIVEGNYLLLDRPPWASLSELFDAVAYLDVPDEVRFRRLVGRHVEFGRSRAEAEAFVLRSDAPNAMLVEASRPRADLVVPYGATG